MVGCFFALTPKNPFEDLYGGYPDQNILEKLFQRFERAFQPVFHRVF